MIIEKGVFSMKVKFIVTEVKSSKVTTKTFIEDVEDMQGLLIKCHDLFKDNHVKDVGWEIL